MAKKPETAPAAEEKKPGTQAESSQVEKEEQGFDRAAMQDEIAALKKEAADAKAALQDAEDAKAKLAEELAEEQARHADDDGPQPPDDDEGTDDTPGLVRCGEYLEVFCKIPNGYVFTLSSGKKVTLAGRPLSSLMDSTGKRLPGHDYGVTIVSVADYEEIVARWGKLPMFDKRAPKVFARLRGTGGTQQAEEQKTIKTGFEQIKVDGKDRDKTLQSKTATAE